MTDGVEPGTAHVVRAAVEIARIIDKAGNATRDARDSYQDILTQGEHREYSLLGGERLLLQLGLLIEADGRLYPTAPLIVIARLDTDNAADAVQTRMRAREDEGFRGMLGEAGELEVLRACVENLIALGRPDLAAQVQQVSLVDDTLGYDVHAAGISVPARLLEVKTSSHSIGGVFEFYLSRNEYDVGRRNPDQWSLVACRWDPDSGEASIVGWCRAAALGAYLPSDGAGRWTEARVRIAKSVLTQGLPPAV